MAPGLRATFVALVTLLAFAAVAAAGVAPPTDVSYTSARGLQIVDTVDSSNLQVSTLGAPSYIVRTNKNQAPRAVAPCVAETEPGRPNRIRCNISGSNLITAELGDNGDALNKDLCFEGIGDMIVSAGTGNDTVNGGNGRDLLKGEPGNDTLNGCKGDDVVEGGRDNDRIIQCKAASTTLGPTSADVLDGGPGIDTVEFPCGGAVTVTLDDQANDGASGQHDNVKSDVENLTGGPAGDHLTGSTSSVQRLAGGAGDDFLVGELTPKDTCAQGSACRDTLLGGDGDDRLDGLAGEDSLDGELGVDRLFGGDRDDTLFTRDGVKDTVVNCGLGTDTANVDLRDAPSTNCENIDQGALKEGPNVRISKRALRVGRDGRARVKLSCPRKLRSRCKGTLSLSLYPRRARRGATRYSIKPGRSKRVRVRLSSRDRRALAKKRKPRGRIASLERGQHGRKTTIRVVGLKR